MLLRAVLLLSLSSQVFGIDNLKLNSKLDYSSDSLDGPLITGDDVKSGFLSGKTNYVIIYGEGCFNSKRQARRTVELYNKYRDQVHFVVVDLDEKRSPDQQKLVKEYYEGSIPHVLILDANGKPLYNSPGEVDSKQISSIFEQSFTQATGGSK
jgi:thiol-disulfide isomerase/thioredoxin